MTERWLISYKFVKSDFLSGEITEEGFGSVVTDVSPARWILYARIANSKDHYVMYAERISLALAVEIVHGGSGIPTMFFKEVDIYEDSDF